MLRRHSRRRGTLTTTEKIAISHKVFCLQQSQVELAKEYRVTQPCISNIVRRSRGNPKFLEELVSQKRAKEKVREDIAELVLKLDR